MCGIIAYIGPENFNKDKIALLMLHNSLERGKDSSGFYTAETGIIKSIQEAKNFIHWQFNDLPEQRLFIGHVRKRSIGVIKKENAHPFENNGIVGVHNGTINNPSELYKDWTKKFEVDSELIIHRLGNERNVNVLKELSGSATLVIHDKSEPNSLYIYSNSWNNIFRGNIGENVYISSLEDSLKVIRCENIQSFKSDYMYKLTLKNGKVILDKTYKVPCTPKFPVVQRNTSNVSDIFQCVAELVDWNTLRKYSVTDFWVKWIGPTNNIVNLNEYYLVTRWGINAPDIVIQVKLGHQYVADTKNLSLNSVQGLYDNSRHLVALMDGVSKVDERNVFSRGDILRVVDNRFDISTKSKVRIGCKNGEFIIPLNMVRTLTAYEEKVVKLTKQNKMENPDWELANTFDSFTKYTEMFVNKVKNCIRDNDTKELNRVLPIFEKYMKKTSAELKESTDDKKMLDLFIEKEDEQMV